MKKLLVGTSKGLVIFKQSHAGWKVDEVHFRGMPVTVLFEDKRNGNWWVGLAHRHWGQKLFCSLNQGKNWKPIAMPSYPKDAVLGNGKRAVLKKIWTIEEAGGKDGNGLWVGTEPGALFYSENGKSFDLVEGLWNHPSRKDENQWFGAGRDHPFIHSIVVDPRDYRHLYVAVSCAGVFETNDGGLNWNPRNKGLIAAYLPNPDVEVGHDPHRMLLCKQTPDVLWQQNHCGIFRSLDAGQNWLNVTDSTGIADYGFALAVDESNPEMAWVIPAISDEERVAHDLALCVCRTEDGGKSWTALRKGLPQSNCFDIVFRHSLTKTDSQLAFGTATGNLYHSDNWGDSWTLLHSNLARVESICFV